MTAAPPLKLPALDNTFGALLIGTVCSAVLYGVTCLQTFHYFQHYDDGPLTKSSVAALLLFETLHSAFSIHAIYYYVITNYFHPGALLQATWSASCTLLVSSFIMLIVHLFYARRVYHMSRHNIFLTVLVVLLAIAHFGTGLAVTIQSLQLKFFASFAKMIHLVDSSLALAVVTDVIIAASLSFYLHTSRSGIKSTDSLINKLMIYAINNGILTSAFDIITLAFVTTEVDNLIFLSVFQVVGNLYTNSMLATLNARKQNATVIESAHSVPLTSLRIEPASGVTTTQVGSLHHSHSNKSQDMHIHIESHTESDNPTFFTRSKSERDVMV